MTKSLAHLIEAGSDIFLMPSRFEPCGFNQLYSLRYGNPPHCPQHRRVGRYGGRCQRPDLYRQSATGFLFEQATPRQLLRAIDRALNLFNQPEVWKDLQHAGMREDFSWYRSASAYVDLYEQD